MIDGMVVWARSDGSVVIERNGLPYHIIAGDPTMKEVEAYLAEHPEALVDEPKPPEPAPETRAMLKAQEDEAAEVALDMAWVREQRKKAKG